VDDANAAASGQSTPGRGGRVEFERGSGWEVSSVSDVASRGVGGNVGLGVGAAWDNAAGGTSSSSARVSQLLGTVAWGPWGTSPMGGEAVFDNRTHVTLRGLQPGIRYQFRVAALCEPLSAPPFLVKNHAATTPTPLFAYSGDDMYGIRRTLSPTALQGNWSPPSADVRTLPYDVFFSHFDANGTLDWGPVFAPSSVNSLGWSGTHARRGVMTQMRFSSA